MGFAPELLAVASEYIKAQEHEIKLPEDFEDALRELMRTKRLLTDDQFDDPISVENALIRSFEFTYRCGHKQGGTFSWQNRGACFDKLEVETRNWINSTAYDEIVALAPKSAKTSSDNPHRFVDLATTADRQKVNMSEVKNAVLAHLMSKRHDERNSDNNGEGNDKSIKPTPLPAPSKARQLSTAAPSNSPTGGFRTGVTALA